MGYYLLTPMLNPPPPFGPALQVDRARLNYLALSPEAPV